MQRPGPTVRWAALTCSALAERWPCAAKDYFTHMQRPGPIVRWAALTCSALAERRLCVATAAWATCSVQVTCSGLSTLVRLPMRWQCTVHCMLRNVDSGSCVSFLNGRPVMLVELAVDHMCRPCRLKRAQRCENRSVRTVFGYSDLARRPQKPDLYRPEARSWSHSAGAN
jgi:hypothetical protein